MPVTLASYLFYLYQTTGDPFNFLNTVGIFGPQRSSSLVLLPQVFYRYMFKILPNTNLSFTPIFEFVVALGFLLLAILAFKRLRQSYVLYLLIGYLIPTFSGSFSSLPRYVLVLFPGFILAALYLNKTSKVIQALIFLVLFLGLGISTILFVRGYWIA